MNSLISSFKAAECSLEVFLLIYKPVISFQELQTATMKIELAISHSTSPKLKMHWILIKIL